MTAEQAGGQNVRRHPDGGAPGAWALGFLLAGWIVAVFLGHGWELHRIVLTVPFAVVASFLACGEILRARIAVHKPALMLLAAGSLYFLVRAAVSPVRDFGRADALLVTLFAVSFLVGATCLRSRAAVTLLLKAMILVFVAHFLVAVYQRIADPSFALFRLPRYDQEGVSGLFWHRNYLAGMLEFMLPVFVAVVLTTRLPDWRMAVSCVVLLGVLLLFLTKSRAGLMSSMTAVGTVVVLCLMARSAKWTLDKRLAALAGAVLTVIVIAWFGLSIFSRVSEERGQSGNIEEALGSNGRLAFAGMAFDQWTEQPLWGTGSRSFSYKALDYWKAGSWVGAPLMVHNDYMQTLAEYGVPGALAVACFAVILLLRGFHRVRRAENPKDDDDDDGLERGLTIGAVGALVAAMIHGIFDFSLHILPNLMLLGLLVGFLCRLEPAESRKRPDNPTLVVIAVGILVVSSAVALAAAWRGIAVFPTWIKWEREYVRGKGTVPPAKLDLLGEVLGAAPEFSMARRFGRMNLEAYRTEPATHAHRLGLAEDALRLAVERNPFDGSSFAHLAHILDLQGRHEEATPLHLRAVARTWRRESKYGAMSAVAANLFRRAEIHLYKREKVEALALYQRAFDYLESSRKSGHLAGGAAQSKALRKMIVGRIGALQSEKVALVFPSSVPPPPR